jgi:hypothetical protein
LHVLKFSVQGIQLYVEVRDADFGGTNEDELIDRFAINVNRIPIRQQVTVPMAYMGTLGFANLTLSFSVDCFLSYYFPDCEANGCQNHGNCSCFPGYTGVDCEVEIDECEDATCPEGTICVDELNSFTCVPINDCAGVNCNGLGRCVDGVNSFLCICDPGHTGVMCETLLPTNDGIFTITHHTIVTADQILSPRIHTILCIIAVALAILIVTVIMIMPVVRRKVIAKVHKNQSGMEILHVLFCNMFVNS